jgi:hypothetical protein
VITSPLTGLDQSDQLTPLFEVRVRNVTVVPLGRSVTPESTSHATDVPASSVHESKAPLRAYSPARTQSTRIGLGK